jgi:NitT/TauT family transport system substrate-binding protein
MVAEPLLSDLERRGLGRVWRRSDQILPNRISAVLVFSARFARAQPQAARAFLTGYLKGARLYNDVLVHHHGDRPWLIEALAQASSFEAAQLEHAILPGINPNGMINVDSLRRDQQYFLADGLQQHIVDLPSFIDTQFAAYAITQLGEYR